MDHILPPTTKNAKKIAVKIELMLIVWMGVWQKMPYMAERTV